MLKLPSQHKHASHRVLIHFTVIDVVGGVGFVLVLVSQANFVRIQLLPVENCPKKRSLCNLLLNSAAQSHQKHELGMFIIMNKTKLFHNP